MNRSVCFCFLFLVVMCGPVSGGDRVEPQKDPWTGNYPMSFFTKTRTAKTVGKGHLAVSLKMQSVECDEMLSSGCYEELPDTDRNDTFSAVLTAKYGWAENQHLALGIPYLRVDFASPAGVTKSDGLGNIFVFNKWNFVSETRVMPAVSFDVWYYFGNGDDVKKLGSDDDSVKATMALSKAWRLVSLHLNPGYCWNLRDGCDIGEINAGAFAAVHQKLLAGVEYNYTDKEEKGECHDVVPGLVWKPVKNTSFKLGAVINVDSTMKYRDDIGVVAKIFYRF